jgi:hypothetical protein
MKFRTTSPAFVAAAVFLAAMYGRVKNAPAAFIQCRSIVPMTCEQHKLQNDDTLDGAHRAGLHH